METITALGSSNDVPTVQILVIWVLVGIPKNSLPVRMGNADIPVGLRHLSCSKAAYISDLWPISVSSDSFVVVRHIVLCAMSVIRRHSIQHRCGVLVGNGILSSLHFLLFSEFIRQLGMVRTSSASSLRV